FQLRLASRWSPAGVVRRTPRRRKDWTDPTPAVHCGCGLRLPRCAPALRLRRSFVAAFTTPATPRAAQAVGYELATQRRGVDLVISLGILRGQLRYTVFALLRIEGVRLGQVLRDSRDLNGIAFMTGNGMPGGKAACPASLWRALRTPRLGRIGSL